MQIQNTNTELPRNTQFFPVLKNACSSVLRLFWGILFWELLAKPRNFSTSNKTTRRNQDIPRFISSLSSPQSPSGAEIQDGGCWRVTEFTIKNGGNSFCWSSFPGAVLWFVFLVGKDSNYNRNWKEEEDFDHIRQFLEGSTRKTSWGFQNSWVCSFNLWSCQISLVVKHVFRENFGFKEDGGGNFVLVTGML